MPLLMASLLVPFSGCTDRKPAALETETADSLKTDSLPADSLDNIISETPMPKAADESFDDFFFNFASRRKLQMERVVFPLQVEDGEGRSRQMARREWKTDHFFMEQGYYTLIFDHDSQRTLTNDTTVREVTVERIRLAEGTISQYHFGKADNGMWYLQRLCHHPMTEGPLASFLQFYSQFSSNENFQEESMADNVMFSAPDPDDDFNTITGSIAPEQWPFFKPSLIPSGTIYNIRYGQTYQDASQKVLLVLGVANGMEIEMVFRKKGEQWKLTKFNS